MGNITSKFIKDDFYEYGVYHSKHISPICDGNSKKALRIKSFDKAVQNGNVFITSHNKNKILIYAVDIKEAENIAKSICKDFCNSIKTATHNDFTEPEKNQLSLRLRNLAHSFS